jgi:hypothetical protein
VTDLQSVVLNKETEIARDECQLRLYDEGLRCAVGQLCTAEEVLVSVGQLCTAEEMLVSVGQLCTAEKMLVSGEEVIDRHKAVLGLAADRIEVYMEVCERLVVLQAQGCSKLKVKCIHNCCNGVGLPATNTAHESTAQGSIS